MNEIRNVNESNELVFTEAPASWNTRYVDPNGFECQITLRAVNGQELLEKVNSAVTYLLENDCVPFTYNRGGYQGNSNKNTSKVDKDNASKSNDQSNNPAWCHIHQCEMRQWEKEGRVWYSHKVNGDWCNGK